MPRTRSMSWALAGLVTSFLGLPWVARAADPYLEVPTAEVLEHAPAFRYANMGAADALRELDRRKILYQRVEPHGLVGTPIRLTGRLHGVHIHSALPEHERPTTVFEICDARLALALDDMSAVLARHGVVEVIHFTMYRPSVAHSHAMVGPLAPVVEPWRGQPWRGDEAFAKKGRSKKGPMAQRGARHPAETKKVSDKVRGKKSSSRGSRSRHGAKPRRSTQSRHPLGLAIDIGALIKSDGTMLSVGSHFGGRLGARTCGPGASPPQQGRGRELWNIICELHAAKIFTYVLTPNFDQPHQDHFHMDIKPGVRWFLYH